MAQQSETLSPFMEINKLTRLDKDAADLLSHSGYTSPAVYTVATHTDGDSCSFVLTLEKLATPYVKQWKTEASEMDDLANTIQSGNSFGAYDNGQLAGIIICEPRAWNNTLYLAQLQVAAGYRRKGVGTLLLHTIIAQARHSGLRLIELEMQNTNVPAFDFYRKMGFALTGLNLKLYDQEGEEVALFMTYSL